MTTVYHWLVALWGVLILFNQITWASSQNEESVNNNNRIIISVEVPKENSKPLGRIKEIDVIKIIYEDDDENDKRILAVKKDKYIRNKDSKASNGRGEPDIEGFRALTNMLDTIDKKNTTTQKKQINDSFNNQYSDPIYKRPATSIPNHITLERNHENKKIIKNEHSTNRTPMNTENQSPAGRNMESEVNTNIYKGYNPRQNEIDVDFEKQRRVEKLNILDSRPNNERRHNHQTFPDVTNTFESLNEDISSTIKNHPTDEIIFPDSQQQRDTQHISNRPRTTDPPKRKQTNSLEYDFDKQNTNAHINNGPRPTKSSLNSFHDINSNQGFIEGNDQLNSRSRPINSNTFNRNLENEQSRTENLNDNVMQKDYDEKMTSSTQREYTDGMRLEKVRATNAPKEQKRRLCETKYAEYIRIIFPEEEDIEEDINEQDFDGRLLAAPGEYPHMTAIGFETEIGIYDYKCGGSLISENFVITAAHCTNVSGQNPTRVRVGDLNLMVNEKNVEPQTRDIRKIYVHPRYNDSFLYNDIALLELDRSVAFSKSVRPIRLWTRPDTPFPVVFTMGYGSTAFGKPFTRVLTYLNLTLVPNEECQRLLPTMAEAPQGIIFSQICAHDYLMKRDTCQGDSGGPLQYTLKGKRQNKREHYLLLGIISYGLYCRSNYPSVYTRISSYLDWIEKIVWE